MPINTSQGTETAGFAARLRALLPYSWFPTTTAGQPSNSPVLDGVLKGYGAVWAGLWQQLQYAILQTRIATATDRFLEMLAADYLGAGFLRKPGETDTAFQVRIKAAIFAPEVTRTAIISRVTALTGIAPKFVEAFNPTDCGGWNQNAWGWGSGGAWGNHKATCQFFIVAYRPRIVPVANNNGWGGFLSGWGVGLWRWLSGVQMAPAVSDQDIINAILAAKAEGIVAWVQIQDPPETSGQTLGVNFILGASVLA
jgi:hypothetical protein